MESARSDGVRVLLLYPSMNIEWDRVKACEVNVRRPSLGLGYLMAVMRDNGIDYTYRDMVAERLALKDVIDEVKRGAYTTVAMHANSSTVEDVCRLMNAVKEHTPAKMLIGGPGGVEGRAFMEAGADCVCVGEAEHRLAPILRALNGQGELGDILGVVFRGPDGEVVETPAAPFIEDLDTVPFPYRPPEYVRLFGEPVNPAQTGTYFSLMASRGCPYKCSFCYAHKVWEHKTRFRSPDNVLDEMGQIVATWPDAYFTFVDDVWGLDREWAVEFCRKKIERGYRYNWMAILHPLSYAGHREEMLTLMAKAGLNCVSYGAQSSSPIVLKNTHRSPKEPEHLAEHVALCRRLRVLAILTWIFGLPGETHATVDESIAWCMKHRPHLADFHPLYIIPGTTIHEEHGFGPVCDLSPSEVEKACAKGFRTFYSSPRIMIQMADFILRRNPRYLLRLGTPLKRLFIHMNNQEHTLPAEQPAPAT